jgi:phosphoribosylformylglycinamidine cyclo-ligase
MKNGVYAQLGGVNYSELQGFKDQMVRVARRTRRFAYRKNHSWGEVIPLAHGVYLNTGFENGVVITLEGLGNKNWIAEWMYMNNLVGGSRYDLIAQDVIMMALNDNIAHGSVPMVLLDEVSAKTSTWFADARRSKDFADGVYKICKQEQITLGAGESPAYKFLIGAVLPVADAPVMSAVIVGMINKRALVLCTGIRSGDVMIAAPANGWHSNGVSAGIAIAQNLPEQFLTRLPSGRYLGDVMLDPTPSYSRFVRAILDANIHVHAFLPMTGHGVGKLAFDKKELTYVVDNWFPEEEIPEIFHFLREQPAFAHKPVDFLTTYQYGAGYTAFVAKSNVKKAMKALDNAGCPARVIGHVEVGKRGTVFGPWDNLWLDPPGE